MDTILTDDNLRYDFKDGSGSVHVNQEGGVVITHHQTDGIADNKEGSIEKF